MNDSAQAQALRNNAEFQRLPDQIQAWIIQSPNATSDFVEFFGKGGFIDPKDDVKLPSYRPSNPPSIIVNASSWDGLNKPDMEYARVRAFGTLAHEIGHDRYNTGTMLFTGNTAEAYVQYRSEIEAQAIFNAFPIFKDLEQHPDFKRSFPFNDIGYLNGVELAQIYKQWDSGQLTDRASVSWISSKVADAPYALGNPPQDMNRDGVITHRDMYLQDFEQYVKPRLALQSSIRHPATADHPNHSDLRITHSLPSMMQGQMDAPKQEYRFFPRTPDDDYLDAFLDAAVRGDYVARRTLTEQYVQLPHVQVQDREAREALLAEQQRLLEEQLRQEQERQRLLQQMQQEQEHSRSRGFSR